MFPNVPLMLVKALINPASRYDEERINGLQDVVDRLRGKSCSFYLASAAFQGRLWIGLLLLQAKRTGFFTFRQSTQVLILPRSR